MKIAALYDIYKFVVYTLFVRSDLITVTNDLIPYLEHSRYILSVVPVPQVTYYYKNSLLPQKILQHHINCCNK